MYEKQIFFRYPNFRHRALTFSYDDGVKQDRRLIDILRAHGMRATFNLNGGLLDGIDRQQPTHRMTREECLEVFAYEDTEVAMHAYTHPWLEQQPSSVVMQEILLDRINLESMFGRPVQGFAYPFGTYNDTVIDVLRMADAKYARTVESTHNFTLPENWLLLHPTCHHKDKALFDLADRYLAWGENLERPGRAQMSMFYVWGHSYEFDTDGNWDVIERFADKMAGHEEIWYATNMEIYRYVEATCRAEIAPDSSYIYNPTATDLYFLDGKGEGHTVRAGQTLSL